jgi:hypothetical protein
MPEGSQFCGGCGAGVAAQAESTREPSAQALIGSSIAGRYRLLRLVGEGGTGSVFEGEQTLGTARRSVAVKLLRPEWSHDVGVKARFHREAETVARLEHFNTVRIYDFGETEEGTLFIVMEYLEGRSLARVLSEHRVLPPERVTHIVRQIVASLTEAHGLGIVHRDLKPDNILLLEHFASQRDVVKLVDFGIAKGQPAAGASLTKLTEFGAFVGTPAYMSPEQFSASLVGPQSDIYSLAITTYQMLTGRLPFDAHTALEWARAHMVTPPPPLGNDAIPPAMERAVLRALAKDPAERPASAAQFLRELSGADGSAAMASTAMVSAAVAPAAVPPVAPAELPVAPKASPRSVHTAPMTQAPDFAGAVPATQPIAAVAGAAEPARPVRHVAATLSAPPRRPASSLARRAVWALVVLAGGATLVLGFLAVSGGELELWSGRTSAPEPDTDLGAAAPPEPVTISPLDPAPAPVAAVPAPPPAASTTPVRPPPAAPTPAKTPASPAPTPVIPAIPAIPGLPLPPGVPGVPAAGGAAGTGLPVPAAPPPAPGLPAPPALPWNLPSAGACERCLAALTKTDHYAVVNAAAENLLCEDRSARERCERQMDEVAPAHAERVAKEGDCPAALATVAAAVQARVSPERFRAIDALCLR